MANLGGTAETKRFRPCKKQGWIRFFLWKNGKAEVPV